MYVIAQYQPVHSSHSTWHDYPQLLLSVSVPRMVVMRQPCAKAMAVPDSVQNLDPQPGVKVPT